MTDEHKAALSAGRNQGRAVRAYLEALDNHRPKRGRRRSAESIRARLAAIEATLATATPMARLQMVQERIDLSAKLTVNHPTVNLSVLEDAFVATARDYSLRKGISYAAWREVGVPTLVLQRASISRG